ncbi:zinc finger protein 358-like [Schistocerca nitens]|uniref:zinc finger protein 358-like n=1 Tax=Schistocerca nitens TaxID=7011 RepID=UPI002117EC41|nr:zinc finger protein 358-like [Schistocerca nitens]
MYRSRDGVLELVVRERTVKTEEVVASDQLFIKTEDDVPSPDTEGTPGSEPEYTSLQSSGRYMGARRGQIRFKVVSEEDVEAERERQRQNDSRDPTTPRTHFVRYARVGDKTVKLWECGYCGKEFRHQYTLTRHLPTHTGERNFRCEACGKAFRQLSTLSQHRAIHTDARPYVCEMCEKTFNRVSTLISHRKTHSDYKPHRCPTCGKGFHQKGNLRNHVFTHTNERPYKCELCGKGFNQMSNLVCHRAHSHGDRARYTCYICDLEFTRKGALRAHEEYKHGVRFRGPHPRVSGNSSSSNSANVVNTQSDPKTAGGVLIDPIRTRAMQVAEREGQTPFALLKPARGIPVLVKVHPAPGPGRRQMLVPATAEDLRQAGKITVAQGEGGGAHRSPGAKVKAVQIKVPVVATVVQVIAPDGSLRIQVEPPAPEYDLGSDGGRTLETATDDTETDSIDRKVDHEDGETQTIQHVSHSHTQPESDPVCTPRDEIQAEEERNEHMEVEAETEPRSMVEVEMNEEPQQDLLRMARAGDIQFVKDAGDGTYQVLSEQEAAEIIRHPSAAAVEVLDAEVEVDPSEVVTEEIQATTETAEGTSLGALVEAIRSAGYCVHEDGERIVITSELGDVDEGVIEVEPQQVVHQEIVYREEGDCEVASPPYVLLEETAEVVTEVATEIVSSDS